MTATPIPRTLAIANFGDMDISVIDKPPPGRTPPMTSLHPYAKIGDIADNLKLRIDTGDIKKAYWVCPAIDEGENTNLASVVARHEYLRAIFGNKVALVHGRMKPAETAAALSDFADPDGHAQILLATTVIEVGVDVPAATLMVIEDAGRFGLAALHQLRGRIGRGAGGEKSYCLLVHKHLSEIGRQRLEIMRQTTDGFKIADADLRLRGAGDIAGTRQSGLIGFRFGGDIVPGLIDRADAEAKKITEETSGDLAAEHKTLLKIFGHDPDAQNRNH